MSYGSRTVAWAFGDAREAAAGSILILLMLTLFLFF